ncbi:MAG TPA: tetratricopeptide repeat protein [Nitrospirota bacterium]|nr:tetratricopeptide repeat protein [Nitrospirota bacterium]
MNDCVNIGSIYVEHGMPDEGMREFMFVPQLRSLDDIDTASLFVNRGFCYLRKCLPDRAIEFYSETVPVNPNDGWSMTTWPGHGDEGQGSGVPGQGPRPEP